MMRDHVPTGTICQVIQESEVENISNPHLAALADDYAGRILEFSLISETTESG
jgi:hypothetical protein